MSLPSPTEIKIRASQLDINPIEAFAYAAMQGRVPTDLFEFNQWKSGVRTWMQSMNADRAEWYVFIYGYIQAHGSLPFGIDNMRSWMRTKGFVNSADQPTGRVPYPGEDYIGGAGTPPPGPVPCPAGQVWDASQAKCVPAPSPGGTFDNLAKWAFAHPVESAAIGAGVYFVFLRRRR